LIFTTCFIYLDWRNVYKYIFILSEFVYLCLFCNIHSVCIYNVKYFLNKIHSSISKVLNKDKEVLLICTYNIYFLNLFYLKLIDVMQICTRKTIILMKVFISYYCVYVLIINIIHYAQTLCAVHDILWIAYFLLLDIIKIRKLNLYSTSMLQNFSFNVTYYIVNS